MAQTAPKKTSESQQPFVPEVPEAYQRIESRTDIPSRVADIRKESNALHVKDPEAFPQFRMGSDLVNAVMTVYEKPGNPRMLEYEVERACMRDIHQRYPHITNNLTHFGTDAIFNARKREVEKVIDGQPTDLIIDEEQIIQQYADLSRHIGFNALREAIANEFDIREEAIPEGVLGPIRDRYVHNFDNDFLVQHASEFGLQQQKPLTENDLEEIQRNPNSPLRKQFDALRKKAINMFIEQETTRLRSQELAMQRLRDISPEEMTRKTEFGETTEPYAMSELISETEKQNNTLYEKVNELDKLYEAKETEHLQKKIQEEIQLIQNQVDSMKLMENLEKLMNIPAFRKNKKSLDAVANHVLQLKKIQSNPTGEDPQTYLENLQHIAQQYLQAANKFNQTLALYENYEANRKEAQINLEAFSNGLQEAEDYQGVFIIHKKAEKQIQDLNIIIQRAKGLATRLKKQGETLEFPMEFLTLNKTFLSSLKDEILLATEEKTTKELPTVKARQAEEKATKELPTVKARSEEIEIDEEKKRIEIEKRFEEYFQRRSKIADRFEEYFQKNNLENISLEQRNL